MRDPTGTAGWLLGGRESDFQTSEATAAEARLGSDLVAFIAVRQGGVLWYGQLVLCFTARYLGETVELLYVQWFDTVRASARAFNRALTEKELRGPFDAYSVFPGSYFHGHPPTGAPHVHVEARRDGARCQSERARRSPRREETPG